MIRHGLDHNDFAANETPYENRFAKIDQDMAVIKWMIGFNLAFTSVILWKAFSP